MIRHMSNLYCGGCGHLIGVLDPADPPHDAVTRWLSEAPWTGKRTSGELYDEFTRWASVNAPMAVLTHKAWGQAMARVGLTSRRGAKGVRLWVR
jgi:hypothetical protein